MSPSKEGGVEGFQLLHPPSSRQQLGAPNSTKQNVDSILLMSDCKRRGTNIDILPFPVLSCLVLSCLVLSFLVLPFYVKFTVALQHNAINSQSYSLTIKYRPLYCQARELLFKSLCMCCMCA